MAKKPAEPSPKPNEGWKKTGYKTREQENYGTKRPPLDKPQKPSK